MSAPVPGRDQGRTAEPEQGRAAGRERNQSASLRRALAVLEYVRDHAGAGQGLSLSRLAEALGLSKSTVLRLTVPLVEARLLERDRRTGAYRLGHGTLRLGQAYLSTLDLRSVAAEETRELMREAGETVHLVVYEPPYVVYIDKVEDESKVRMASRIGSRGRLYCTAVGKAILAWQPEAVVAETVAAGMPALTRHTITDPVRLRTELARIRQRGYAVDDRENEPEVRCVAAPIFGHDDSVSSALSVSGLTSRITAARVRDLGPLVARTALRISRKLGSLR
ncbi:IclR family transcriptional regulator [Planomonospora venezuelensis]|uniref:DNA-binding IclR family transcriptional regulator n=1 Tax=Planomonospora venezuelensis TaxID=1999 RepID=A0A841D5R1_PLAVE|nr:IclR family transcriptional regulator [Planomonospora venezuelensis]MBB5963475.1 DNA-binding IclR family transcriptional regulator [Planomonospora venezuelensis]GIN02199.1 IclR family transcriptional regulator [Planomonospora venezuelensis]